MTWRIAPLLLAVSAATGCAQPDEECLVADTLEVADQETVDGTEYVLIRRTSGWSDKAEILEIYAGSPQFDACGQPKQPPLADHPVDPGLGSPVIASFQHGELKVEYAERQDSRQGIKLAIPGG